MKECITPYRFDTIQDRHRREAGTLSECFVSYLSDGVRDRHVSVRIRVVHTPRISSLEAEQSRDAYKHTSRHVESNLSLPNGYVFQRGLKGPVQWGVVRSEYTTPAISEGSLTSITVSFLVAAIILISADNISQARVHIVYKSEIIDQIGDCEN